MKKKLLILGLASALITILPGCVKVPKYKPKKLQNLSKQDAHFNETKKAVTVLVKKLDTEDCYNLFDEYNIFLTKSESLHPFQLTIENRSSIPYVVLKENVTVKQEKYDLVSKKMAPTTFGAIASYGSASFITAGLSGVLCFPLASGLYYGFPIPLSIPYITIVAGCIIATGTFIGLAIKNSLQIHEIQSLIYQDIKNKTLDSLIIQPQSTKSTLIFVHKKDLQDQFKVTLHSSDRTNASLAFNVDLQNIKVEDIKE